MTSSQIIKLITDEQSVLHRRKSTALAKGDWIKAHNNEQQNDALDRVRAAIVEKEVTELTKTPEVAQ